MLTSIFGKLDAEQVVRRREICQNPRFVSFDNDGCTVPETVSFLKVKSRALWVLNGLKEKENSNHSVKR